MKAAVITRSMSSRGNALLLRGAGAEVIRYKKPTFAKPAPVDLRQQISVECDAMLEALAD